MNSTTIIEATQANDTLVVALGKPSRALRSTYYAMLAALIAAAVWAYCSVVDVSVHAQGVVRPLGGVHAVQSTTTAYIRFLPIRENQFVQAGDTLAVLDASASEERMKMLGERVRRLQEEIADIRALAELSPSHIFHFPTFARERDVARAEAALRRKEIASAQAKFQRTSDLWAKNFVSREEYENARLQVEQKEQALEQWTQSHRRNALEREKQGNMSLAEQESSLKELSLEHQRTVLRSPASGFVTNLAVRSSGVVLTPSAPLCVIAPRGEQCVEFVVAARDIGFLREGLRVRYQLDALPFQEWGTAEGRIVSIAKDVSLTSGQGQQAGFKIVGTMPSEHLFSQRQHQKATVSVGMTCRASIIVAEKRLLSMLWDKTITYFALQ
ncbi:MAG: HlyD family secretion protein [Candidatus Kapaibacteriota bacterium]